MKCRVLIILFSVFILTACSPPITDQNPTETKQAEKPEVLVTSSPTSSQIPPDMLTICTNEFPKSLFPYDGLNSNTKTNILAMLQESPFTTVNGELQPVILEKVPTQADGDLRLESLAVQEGQVVVDAQGELVVLKPGVLVRPSGCRQSGCAIIWDGERLLEMDQMVVEYKLRDGLVWSDGIPVSASDSEFGYRLTDTPEAPGNRWAVDRTQAYIALDAHTIQWVGRPGFSTAQLAAFFWTPLPSHLINDFWSWSELSEDDRLTTFPLSYGPFMLTSWDGMQMRFEPNPYYYLSDEGLPSLDSITIQLVDGGTQGAWEALQSGQCDLLDSTFGLENDPDLLSEIQIDERFAVRALMRYDWVQLVFGIQPGPSEGFDNAAAIDRPNLLGDPLTRQAVAACLDRGSMRDATTQGLSELWPSFLPSERSQLSLDSQITYDLQLGKQLLEQAGWQDPDKDPGSPRISVTAASVPVGTELSLNLLINYSGFHQDLADIIQQSLGECGIGVNVITMPASELYAPGSEGPLFGRHFDFALISWQPMMDLDCRYYQTSQIPDAENLWIGTNIAGHSDEAFDHACSNAVLALPSESAEAVHQAELLFLDDLAAIPLFSIPRLMVASGAICFEREILAESDFFGLLEYYEMDGDCP